MQEDRDIGLLIDKKIAEGKDPVRVVTIKEHQHALDLWEPLCDTGSKVGNSPLLLLPEFYAYAGAEKDVLDQLARVFWANLYVSCHDLLMIISIFKVLLTLLIWFQSGLSLDGKSNIWSSG